MATTARGRFDEDRERGLSQLVPMFRTAFPIYLLHGSKFLHVVAS